MTSIPRWTALALTIATLAMPLAAADLDPTHLITSPPGVASSFTNFCNNEPGGDDVFILVAGADLNFDGNGYAACVADFSVIVHDVVYLGPTYGATVSGALCTKTTCAPLFGTTGATILVTNAGTILCVGPTCPQVVATVWADGIPVMVTTP